MIEEQHQTAVTSHPESVRAAKVGYTAWAASSNNSILSQVLLNKFLFSFKQM